MDAQTSSFDNYLYLAGRPSIRDFLGFMRRHKINGVRKEREGLIKQWIETNEIIRDLEKADKGIADSPETLPLPESMQQIADMALDSPTIREMWAGLRYRWRMVELDRLVVFQRFINLSFVDQIKGTLNVPLKDEDLINAAVGKAWRAAPVEVTRSDEYTFMCISPSNDLRVLEIDTIDPEDVRSAEDGGHTSTIIGIRVGFSVNLLSAVYSNGRYVLFNGSHRAYALRELGVTQAPCLVLDLARDEEFDLKAPEPLKENRDLCLRSPRPPLFKDYLDPKLRALTQVPRMRQLVQFQIGYQKVGVAAV